MKSKAKIKKLLSVARAMLGTPYEYGAYTKPLNFSTLKPRGVDCSSLIQYAYSRIGIDLPRSSILQATKGNEVRGIKNLKPGDLIFFETTKGHYWHSAFSGRKIYIGHVALYIGSGEIIDASDERNNGRVAKMKLSELMRYPAYRVILIKRILGTAYPSYNVPAYSQFLDVIDASWKNRACGIVTLKMVIDFWRKLTKKGYLSVDQLIKKHNRSAYINGVGWSHKGLVQVAKRYGLAGENFDWAHYSTKDSLALLETKLDVAPVIASIHRNLNPLLSGHLVVITKIKKGRVFYNDPDAKTRRNIKRNAQLEKFLRGWKKRVIVLYP